MPGVGFEPTIPASEGAKTVHALDSAVTETGCSSLWIRNKAITKRLLSQGNEENDHVVKGL
jgi:hypothetical protein